MIPWRLRLYPETSAGHATRRQHGFHHRAAAPDHPTGHLQCVRQKSYNTILILEMLTSCSLVNAVLD